MKTTNLSSAFFDDEGDCIEHGDYKCERCYDKSRTTHAATTALVISGETPDYEKADVLKEYRKQIKFVKTALNLKDEALAKKKVTELPMLITKAKEEVTIGQMDKLLTEEHIPNGFLRTIYRFFERGGRGDKRRR